MDEDIKILLVDDEPLILSIFRSNLKELGYHSVTVATDFPGAVDAFTRQKIDLLISDIQMGSRSGLDLLRVVRLGETMAPRNLPAILLTGHADHEVIAAAKLLGVSGFLKKPAAIKALGQGIEKAMRNRLSEVVVSPEIESAVECVARRYRVSGSAKGPAGGRRKPGEARDAGRTALENYVDVASLRAGMTLAKDLVGDDGKLIVRSGVSMTDNMIKHIRLYYSTQCPELFLVRRGGDGDR